MNRLTGLVNFDWMHAATAASLRSDVLAGLTGAAIVLPQAVTVRA